MGKGIEMYSEENLIKALIDCGALKFGEFVLASGRKSEYYIDAKLASTIPRILEMISEGMASTATATFREYDLIAGMELGAVPLAVALSLRVKKPYLIIRKKEKGHGIRNRIVGQYNRGMKVLLVEDVVTTGGSVISAMETLDDEGLSVIGVMAVVDRNEGGREAIESRGVKFSSLTSAEKILELKEVMK